MKKLLLIGAILITSTAGANIALANQEELIAEDKPPIVLQVEEHEVRLDEHDSEIDNLETKTDNIQGQVSQNTNTVTEVRERVVVVEKKVDEPKPQTPTPEPEPELDPWTIVDVERTYRKDEDFQLIKCVYLTLSEGTWWTASAGYVSSNWDRPCDFAEGEVLDETNRKHLVNRPIDVF